MDKVKLAIIFNPAARGEKARSLEQKLRSLTEADAFLLSRSGETAALARELAQEGYSTIVAAGGDGTVNEVVNGIAGLDVSLGILPIGTMNVLAYELGIPTTQLEHCWEIIQRGFTRSIDLAMANDQYFVQLAGVGLDALAVRETDLNMKKTIGPISYIFAAAQIIGRPAPRLEICFNQRETMGGCFVLVGTAASTGGHLPFFPMRKTMMVYWMSWYSSTKDTSISFAISKVFSPVTMPILLISNIGKSSRYVSSVIDGFRWRLMGKSLFTPRCISGLARTNFVFTYLGRAVRPGPPEGCNTNFSAQQDPIMSSILRSGTNTPYLPSRIPTA